MLTLVKEKLYYHNGVYMGDILADMDGFYKFWPDKTRYGYWDAGCLREIADFLDTMNIPWQDEVEKLCSK